MIQPLLFPVLQSLFSGNTEEHQAQANPQPSHKDLFIDSDGDGFYVCAPSVSPAQCNAYFSEPVPDRYFDCDDNNAFLPTVWSPDSDRDGYGNLYSSHIYFGCVPPSMDYVSNSLDCFDNDSAKVKCSLEGLRFVM